MKSVCVSVCVRLQQGFELTEDILSKINCFLFIYLNSYRKNYATSSRKFFLFSRNKSCNFNGTYFERFFWSKSLICMHSSRHWKCTAEGSRDPMRGLFPNFFVSKYNCPILTSPTHSMAVERRKMILHWRRSQGPWLDRRSMAMGIRKMHCEGSVNLK